MQILIDGKDISDCVTIGKCIHEDSVSGKSDTLSISFNDDTDAETNWRKWNLEKGTEIEANIDGFSSGIMYVSAAYVRDGRFDVVAQSAKSQSRDEYSQSYESVSFLGLLEEGAKSMELTLDIYDITDHTYDTVIRIKQSWMGFLNERCTLEGAGIKIYDKKMIVFDEKSFEQKDVVDSFVREDFSSDPEFSTNDNLIRELRNMYRSDELIDTTVYSGVSYGRRIELEQPCSDIGESIRFSNNIMRSVNKNEYVMRGKLSGCSLSAGVTVNLNGDFFGDFEGINFVTKVKTDMINMSQLIHTRKPISGDY
ncbi:MAG: hypothetical protein MR945_09125 [Agathobacter sp.]|nr:hypothetical protein [Agathobacter sp.]